MQGKAGTAWSPAECTCHLVSWSAHSSSKIFSRISRGSLSKKGDDVWGSAVAAMADRSLAMSGRELGCFYGCVALVTRWTKDTSCRPQPAPARACVED